MLKPVGRVLTFGAFVDSPSGDGDKETSSFCANDFVHASGVGSLTGITWVKRFAPFVVVLSIVLIPWGGPCERWTRPAAPRTVSGFPTYRTLLTQDQSVVGRTGDGAALPLRLEDILDDDEDPEDESVLVVDGLVPPSPQACCRLDAVHGIGALGHVARCPILRC
jgi:hypothetical protein